MSRDKKDSWDAAKDFQMSKGDTPDSSKSFARAEHQARNDYQDEGSIWGSLSSRDRDSKSDIPSSESESSNDNSRVICTHLMRVGLLDRKLWREDMEYTRFLKQNTINGYHFWAIPYVKLMRRSSVAERIILPLATARAIEVSYQMGRRPAGSSFGKLVRLVGEPVCWLIGLFVSVQNWEALYASKTKCSEG